MKKNLLYLGLITGSLLFTGCSEDSNSTEKKDTLGVQQVQENTEISQVQTATEEIKEETKESTTPSEQGLAIKEEASSIEDQVPATAKENDKDNTVETNRLNEKKMKIGIIYMMKKGETIKKISSEPKLVIETDIETGETTATLLEGEAKIKKSSIFFH